MDAAIKKPGISLVPKGGVADEKRAARNAGKFRRLLKITGIMPNKNTNDTDETVNWSVVLVLFVNAALFLFVLVVAVCGTIALGWIHYSLSDDIKYERAIGDKRRMDDESAARRKCEENLAKTKALIEYNKTKGVETPIEFLQIQNCGN